MNSNSDSHNLTGFPEDTEPTETLSIDEFFRQLEAKERDLDISSELVIEIEDDEDDERSMPENSQLNPFVVGTEQPSPVVKTADNSPSVDKNPPSQIELFSLRNEILKLQTQLIRAENERAEMIEAARRRFSDFENYKNRTERERADIFHTQISNLAFQILPVLDNMNRAIESTKKISDQKITEFQQFFEGIEMVSQQLNEILAEMGVQPIIVVGEDFDPHLHEAVATVQTADETEFNKITEELLRGYRIGNKVIRPSMVKVFIPPAAG